MIRVMALYPNSRDAKFDFDYYVQTHLALSRKLLGDYGMGEVVVQRGLEGMDGDSPPYACVAHVEFSSLDRLKRGLEKHAAELLADIPNYTNIEPEVQIVEVVATG